MKCLVLNSLLFQTQREKPGIEVKIVNCKKPDISHLYVLKHLDKVYHA